MVCYGMHAEGWWTTLFDGSGAEVGMKETHHFNQRFDPMRWRQEVGVFSDKGIHIMYTQFCRQSGCCQCCRAAADVINEKDSTPRQPTAASPATCRRRPLPRHACKSCKLSTYIHQFNRKQDDQVERSKANNGLNHREILVQCPANWSAIRIWGPHM